LITREKQILLSKITDQIDVAVIAGDGKNHISLMNPAAERFFHQRFEDRQGWPVASLGLQNVVDAARQEGLNKVSEFEIGENKRKVFVRTDTYFELGQPNYLIFVTDIQQILRDEERLAWQRLLRVLSHEINNSLTPIASIAETLTQLVENQALDESIDARLHQSMKEGLSVVSERAHSLNHFI
jgi:nitrogen fixation/metabolism regulation signal transduction histidine kinase